MKVSFKVNLGHKYFQQEHGLANKVVCIKALFFPFPSSSHVQCLLHVSLFSALVLLPSIPKIQAVMRILSNQSTNFSNFGKTLTLHAFLNGRLFFFMIVSQKVETGKMDRVCGKKEEEG